MGPNLKGIWEADLEEQFELAMRIRDKTTAANEAVIRIRDMREAINERMDLVDGAQVQKMAENLLAEMQAIEEELYQTKNVSNQDPLNFPIRLNNRLASLRRSVENGDARPTDGAYQVFEELSAELTGHLERLDRIVETELPRLNEAFTGQGLKAVGR